MLHGLGETLEVLEHLRRRLPSSKRHVEATRQRGATGLERTGLAEDEAVVPPEARAGGDDRLEESSSAEECVDAEQPAEGVAGIKPQGDGAVTRLDGRDELVLEEVEEALAPARCGVVGVLGGGPGGGRQVARALGVEDANHNDFRHQPVAGEEVGRRPGVPELRLGVGEVQDGVALLPTAVGGRHHHCRHPFLAERLGVKREALCAGGPARDAGGEGKRDK